MGKRRYLDVSRLRSNADEPAAGVIRSLAVS
jgi:hypothetical protein